MKTILTIVLALAFTIVGASSVLAIGRGGTPPTVSLSASNVEVSPGDSVTLTWSSTNATSCSSSQFPTGGTSGAMTVTPDSLPTTYSITCDGAGGSATDSVTIRQGTSGSCDVTVTAGQTQNYTFVPSLPAGAYDLSYAVIAHRVDGYSTDNQQFNSDGNYNQQPFTVSKTWTTPGNYQIQGWVTFSRASGCSAGSGCAGTDPYQQDTMTSPTGSVYAEDAPPVCHVTVLPAKTNLTAGGAPDLYGTLGQSITVMTTNGQAVNVTNNGQADAGGFTTRFTVNGGSPIDVNTGGLSQGASTDLSATFPAGVFPWVGAYTYQYCVDSNGNVDESDESNGDNCRSGNIYIGSAPSACQLNVLTGQSTTFQMTTNGYLTSRAYHANYSINWGNTTSTGWIEPGAEPYVASHTWDTAGDYKVEGYVGDIQYINTPPSSGAGSAPDTLIAPNGQTATWAQGTSSAVPKYCNVHVYDPAPAPTASISLSPSSVAYGGSSTLSWSCGNADYGCTGTGFSTGGAASGSITVSPTKSTYYRVDASGAGGTTYADQSLSVGQPYPDVTARRPDTAVSAVWGNSFNVTGTVINIGAAAMNGPFSVTAQVCDGFGSCGQYNHLSAIQIGTLNPDPSGVGVTIPVPSTPSASVGGATYSYRICADEDAVGNKPVNESNEDNNCSGWQTINVTAPDLTTDTSSGNGVAPTVYGDLGQPVSVSGIAVNIGNAGSGGFSNMFVTNWNGSSWNSITDGSYIGGLGQGGSQAGFSGTFPASTFASKGTYAYSYCAGINSGWQQSLSNESNNNNNCEWSGNIVIRAPDLTAGNPTPWPATTLVNTPITFSTQINNGGDGSSVSFPVFFEVVNDGTKFGYTYLNGIAPNAPVTATASYTFTSPGTYQVMACVNNNTSWKNIAPESKYDNDCSAWDTVNVYPVPTVSLTLTPNSIAYGGSSTLNWSCTGADACTGYGFSTGNANSGSITVNPTQTTSYSLGAWNGSGTTANTSATLTVGQPYPNLTADNNGPVVAKTGSTPTLSGTIQNIGAITTSGSFYVQVRFCDANCATIDRSVFTSTQALAPGPSRAVSFSQLTMPSRGNYYYQICADAYGDVHESKEDDNCSGWQSVTVTAPDLVPTPPGPPIGPVSPTTGTAGSPVTFTASAKNQGDAASDSFPILFQVEENGDLFSSNYVAGLASGSTGSASGAYTFSRMGTYHVRECVNQIPDVNRDVVAVESNYGNNCGDWIPVTISAPNPLGEGVTPTTAIAGSPVTLVGSVTDMDPNTGVPSADITTSFPNWIIIRNAANGGGSDVFDNNVTASPLASGAHETINDLPYTFPSEGTYSVLVCAGYGFNGTTDPWTRVPANSSGGGCGPWTNITVGPAPKPDLIGLTPPNITVQQGNAVPVSGTVMNQGTVGTGASFKNIFKTDPQGNGTWRPAAGSSTGAPLAGGNATESVSGTLPAFTQPGVYPYVLCADEDIDNGWAGSIDEGSNEGNNCSVQPGFITVQPPPPPPSCSGMPTLSLTANPNRVVKNGSATLSWRVTNTLNSCTVTNSNGTTIATIPAGQCSDVATSSMSTGPLTKQTVYSLNCTNAGTAYATTTVVNVVPKFNEF